MQERGLVSELEDPALTPAYSETPREPLVLLGHLNSVFFDDPHDVGQGTHILQISRGLGEP